MTSAVHASSSLPLPTPDRPWALFLDVDGTLLEIAATPDAVVVPPAVPAVLQDLRRALHGGLALVSGRSLATIDRLMGDSSMDAAGCHGAEFRAYGETVSQVCDETAFRAAAQRINAALAGHPGTLVESKPLSLAFHYRNAEINAAEAFAMASTAIRDEEIPLHLIEGKKVIEILPQGVGKGAAIVRFMGLPAYRGRIPVFIGDDVTDEDGFAEVDRLKGISIRVGTGRETFARHHIDSVPDVLRWLARDVLPTLVSQGEGVA